MTNTSDQNITTTDREAENCCERYAKETLEVLASAFPDLKRHVASNPKVTTEIWVTCLTKLTRYRTLRAVEHFLNDHDSQWAPTPAQFRAKALSFPASTSALRPQRSAPPSSRERVWRGACAALMARITGDALPGLNAPPPSTLPPWVNELVEEFPLPAATLRARGRYLGQGLGVRPSAIIEACYRDLKAVFDGEWDARSQPRDAEGVPDRADREAADDAGVGSLAGG